jgi:hypothetical protein
LGRIPDIKRLRQEDFGPEDQALIGKLAYSLNTFMDQVISVLNGNVDFLNLNQEIKDVTVELDGSGNIAKAVNINTALTTKVAGIVCIRADNLDDSSVTPTGQPFMTFDIINTNLIQLKTITGLQNSSRYKLKLLLIG